MCKSTAPFPNRLPGLVECITPATVATRRLISEPTEEMPQTRPNNKITRKEQMKYVILSHKPPWNINKSNFLSNDLHEILTHIHMNYPNLASHIYARGPCTRTVVNNLNTPIGCQVMDKNRRGGMPGRPYGMCHGCHLKTVTLHWEVIKGNAGGLMSSTTRSIRIIIK